MTIHESQRIEDHIKFWKKEKPSKPLVSFYIGNYFFASHYKAAKPLLVNGKKITPAMIDVDAFLEDYERRYTEINKLDQSGFWVAEPYTGIPWREAFWGCSVIAGENGFSAKPCIQDIHELENLRFSLDNPWVQKYFEFIKKLNALSAGRFPVGQPIMRGQGDLLGALLGQREFIYALYEEPAAVRKFNEKALDAFFLVNEEMHKINPPFLGGTSIGFYHIWAPGKCIWYQEDSCAFLSPDLYKEFLLETEKRICTEYDYTLVHLHPSSFYILDAMLTNKKLGVVEINKDIGGPNVMEMLPQYKKVLDSGTRLMIWGDLTKEEIRFIFDTLPAEGIFLNIVTPDFASAQRLSEFIKTLA